VVAAIDVAEETGFPLRIAGIIQDEAYFEREVAPRLDGERVRFVGSVRADDRSSFLGGAKALLHLINFDEPFGLSVVEAMACGTPVIAFDRGSMSEIIDQGTTGCLVADVASAIDATRRVDELDRRTIRAVAVQRFSIDRMVDEYVEVYRHVIAEHARRSSRRCVDVSTDIRGSPGLPGSGR
jgi:glycosyltransferase involved in cell wall biosynthesis